MSDKTKKEMLLKAIESEVPEGDSRDRLLELVEEMEDDLLDEIDQAMFWNIELTGELGMVKVLLEMKATFWKCEVAHCGHVFERDENRCPLCYG